MSDSTPEEQRLTAAKIAASVQAQIAARQAAQERARHIIETAENLEVVVKSEVSRRMSEHLAEVQDNIRATIEAVEKRDAKISRMLVLRALVGISNRLSILSAAYQSGALPK